MNNLTAILLGVLLLIGNGLFVAAEFAVVTARRHRLEETAARGGRLVRTAARTAVRNGRELSLMLAGAQLGITLCSLGLGMVAEPAIEHLLEPVFGLVGMPESLRVPIAFAFALALVTFLHMVAGEMAPKSWALTHAEAAAMGLALPFRGFTWLARPLLATLNGCTNALLRLFGIRPRDELATARTPHQLAMIVGESGRMGLLDRDEHDLLTRALNVDSQTIEPLTRPITEAARVSADADEAEIRRIAAQTNHLRLLVTGATPQDVLGVLHVRDALLHPGTRPRDLATPAPRLAATTTIPDALATLQDAHAHLGLVTTNGQITGLISQNDLINQLLTA